MHCKLPLITYNYQSKGFEDVYNAQAERIAAWDKERLKLLENTAELGDVSMAYELGVKNYSQLNRGAVNLAKAIVDATAGTVAVTAGFIGEGLEEVGGSSGMYEMSQFLQDIGGTYINAEKTFRERQEETFADPPKLGDVSSVALACLSISLACVIFLIAASSEPNLLINSRPI